MVFVGQLCFALPKLLIKLLLHCFPLQSFLTHSKCIRLNLLPPSTPSTSCLLICGGPEYFQMLKYINSIWKRDYQPVRLLYRLHFAAF